MEMAERHGRMLSELAELGLSMARGLHGRVEAAAGVEEAQGLVLAFHRVSRSVRMSLALEARLARERAQGAREDRAEAVREAQDQVFTRKAQVRAAVTRAVLAERENDEAETLLDALEDRVDEAALYDGFIASPVEAQIARIRTELGLDPGPSLDLHADEPDASVLPPGPETPAQNWNAPPGPGLKGAHPSGGERAGTYGRAPPGNEAHPALQPTNSP